MTSQRTATKEKSLYHYVLIFVFRPFTYTCLLFSVFSRRLAGMWKIWESSEYLLDNEQSFFFS